MSVLATTEPDFHECIKLEDRDFRRRAVVHPEKVHVDLFGQELGEGVYTLYTQNMWKEITGPRVWRVSTTYWANEIQWSRERGWEINGRKLNVSH